MVGENGIETDPSKVEQIRNFPRPSNPDERRSFVALAGYYRKLVFYFSKVSKPLFDLLSPTST